VDDKVVVTMLVVVDVLIVADVYLDLDHGTKKMPLQFRRTCQVKRTMRTLRVARIRYIIINRTILALRLRLGLLIAWDVNAQKV
jgi:hypothetical protein